MASTSPDWLSTVGRRPRREKNGVYHETQTEKLPSLPVDGSNKPKSELQNEPESLDQFKPHQDNTHRRLKPRHIQLIGIGGCVDESYHQIEVVDAKASLVALEPSELSFLCRSVCLYFSPIDISYADRRAGRAFTEVRCTEEAISSPVDEF